MGNFADWPEILLNASFCSVPYVDHLYFCRNWHCYLPETPGFTNQLPNLVACKGSGLKMLFLKGVWSIQEIRATKDSNIDLLDFCSSVTALLHGQHFGQFCQTKMNRSMSTHAILPTFLRRERLQTGGRCAFNNSCRIHCISPALQIIEDLLGIVPTALWPYFCLL